MKGRPDTLCLAKPLVLYADPIDLPLSFRPSRVAVSSN